MERGQIKKALECCASEEYKCTQCPIDEKTKDDCECGKLVARNALSLIKQLTEENERLRAQNETLEIYNADYKFRNKELTAFNRRWAKECADLQDECEQIKSDTVRKMQERFIAEIEQTPNANEHFIKAWKSKIDQIAKEMLEGV